MMAEFCAVGNRVRQRGGARRFGTVVDGIWSGYVAVQWESGRTETGVHINELQDLTFEEAGWTPS